MVKYHPNMAVSFNLLHHYNCKLTIPCHSRKLACVTAGHMKIVSGCNAGYRKLVTLITTSYTMHKQGKYNVLILHRGFTRAPQMKDDLDNVSPSHTQVEPPEDCRPFNNINTGQHFLLTQDRWHNAPTLTRQGETRETRRKWMSTRIIGVYS